jgi:hypothetical protein
MAAATTTVTTAAVVVATEAVARAATTELRGMKDDCSAAWHSSAAVLHV